MTKIKISAAVICATFISGVASAQQGSPPPGSGNSTQITSGNREQNAGYNHVVSNMDPVKQGQPAEQPKSGLKGKAVAATSADLKVGSPLRDSQGVAIGTVSAVETDGVVVDTGTNKVKVPAIAFGKDDAGLLLGITAARFAELVAGTKASN